MNILLAIILGSLFGFALYYVGAANPNKLKAMLSLEELSLMKIILFAIGFASVLLSVANFLGIFDFSHINIKTTNLGVVIGGMIFGIGFGTVGTCPGTCIAAAGGEGFKKGLATILGGLLGAFTFSQIYGFLDNQGFFKIMDWGKITLFNISDKYTSIFNIGYGGLLIVGILMMVISYSIPLRTKIYKK